MGVYIKGMEIPKSCGECLDIGWHYVFDCRLDDAEEGERLPNCPLVPVPPHGRLIDADALMKHKGNCYDADGHLLYAVGTGSIMCAPTIIPAEEGE